jgi:hypothetical protein
MTRLLRSCALLALATSVAPAALFAQTLTFAAPKTFTVILPDSAGVFHSSAADFTGDGKMDYLLEAVNQGDLLDFALMVGNGYGSFTTKETNVPIPMDTENEELPDPYAAVDVNNDGKTDIITMDPGCQTSYCRCDTTPCTPTSDLNGIFKVWVNQGNADFVNTYTGTLPPHLGSIVYAVADFNGDGKPDIAVLSTFTSTGKAYPAVLTVFLNKGDGLFTQTTDTNLPNMDMVPPAVPDIVAGNFIGSGHKDLTFSYESITSKGATVLYTYTLPNNGKGSFGTPVLAYSGGIADGVAIDLNGDGLTDLVTFGPNFTLQVYFAKHGGGFTAGPRTPTYYNMFADQFGLTDMNGDGKPDLWISGGTRTGNANNAAIYFGNGNGTFNSSYKAIHPSGAGGGGDLMSVAPLAKGDLSSVMFQTAFDQFELYVNKTVK